MKRHAAAVGVGLTAVLLATLVGGAAPGAGRPGGRGLDLVASAHATSTHAYAQDAVFDEQWARDSAVKVDAASTTSATCDGCGAESTALQVVYVSRAELARLDNSAVAWTQACSGCTASALSAQVVVVRGMPETRPNNRAMSLTASCAGCRTAAVAFQVVVIGDPARRLSDQSMAELRAWFDEQAALVRASVAPDPSASPPLPSPSASEPTDAGSAPPDPVGKSMGTYVGRKAKRASARALSELRTLVTADLAADAVLADVDLGR